MVEGEYRFMLKVWTNTNEYSQSTVHVYVHSTLNTNRIQMGQQRKYKQENELNENIIQIELDIEPNLFSEYLKDRFLSKFQLMLQEQKMFKLMHPQVVLINTKIASPVGYSQKSSVILELIVTDLINEGFRSEPMPIQDGGVFNDEVDLIGENRKIVNNSHLIRLLRKNQKVFQFSFNNINSMLAYFKAPEKIETIKHYSILDSLDIKVLTVSKLTCTDDFSPTSSSNTYNCSNHGKCDFHSHKCICNKFWMPNLYLYYFDYESDLTNGNNCGINNYSYLNVKIDFTINFY